MATLYKTTPQGNILLTDEEEAEILAQWATNDAAKLALANDYKTLRAAEYPDITAQLDMIYWDAVNGTTTFKDTRAAVKAKYPKPTE